MKFFSKKGKDTAPKDSKFGWFKRSWFKKAHKKDGETEKALEEKKTEKKEEKMKKGDTKTAYKVLIRPHVTEKTAKAAGHGEYIFEVAKDANQAAVEQAIYSVYGVMPLKVNIISQKGKIKRFGRRIGKRKDWKKAVVMLPKGVKLDVYSGV